MDFEPFQRTPGVLQGVEPFVQRFGHREGKPVADAVVEDPQGEAFVSVIDFMVRPPRADDAVAQFVLPHGYRLGERAARILLHHQADIYELCFEVLGVHVRRPADQLVHVLGVGQRLAGRDDLQHDAQPLRGSVQAGPVLRVDVREFEQHERGRAGEQLRAGPGHRGRIIRVDGPQPHVLPAEDRGGDQPPVARQGHRQPSVVDDGHDGPPGQARAQRERDPGERADDLARRRGAQIGARQLAERLRRPDDVQVPRLFQPDGLQAREQVFGGGGVALTFALARLGVDLDPAVLAEGHRSRDDAQGRQHRIADQHPRVGLVESYEPKAQTQCEDYA